MSKYEEIYEVAADNYGIVTRDEAARMGVSDKELSRFTSDGRLTRIGRGVYRIKHHVPGNLDPYAESVALAGPGAYLYGESVLAMFALCPTNPAKMYIGTPRRIRRKLPEGMKAISSCVGKIMPDRLQEAVWEARRQGLLGKDEAEKLDREVSI